MKRNWSKKLLAGVLSLAMVFTAAFAVSPQMLKAGAAQAANTADRTSASRATRTA